MKWKNCWKDWFHYIKELLKESQCISEKSFSKELLSNLFELQCCPLTINPFFVGMMCTFPLQKYETSKEWGLGENPAQREIDQHQTSHSCEYCQTSIIFACRCLCLKVKLHECLNFTVEGILVTKTSISSYKDLIESRNFNTKYHCYGKTKKYLRYCIWKTICSTHWFPRLYSRYSVT